MKCIEGAPPGIGSEEVIFWYPSSSGGESTHQHAIGNHEPVEYRGARGNLLKSPRRIVGAVGSSQ
jgi:hypothetical protein